MTYEEALQIAMEELYDAVEVLRRNNKGYPSRVDLECNRLLTARNVLHKRLEEMQEKREWVGLDDNGDCVTRPYPFSPQTIKRERESMRKKCIVKDCENHAHQGGFTGDLCNPCYDFISEGRGVYSQAYRNAQREWVGLTGYEIRETIRGTIDEVTVSQMVYCVAVAKSIEAKLKEKNT